MATSYTGLGDSQAKPSCQSRLAASNASLGLTEAGCCLFDRIWEARPAIIMEKKLRCCHKLGGVESLGIFKVGHTILAMLMESQIWHQPIGSVGGGPNKRTMASARPDARHFRLSLYTTGALQVATLVELRRSKSE